MSFAELFAPKIHNCNEVLNAGSLLFVQKISCPNNEPTVHTLTVGAAGVAVNDEEIPLTSDQVETRLRKGAVLYFGTDTVTVAEETVINNAGETLVPIEAAATAIAAAATGETWALLQILSPTNLPTNIEAQEVNRTDLTYDLQGGMVKTKIELNPQVTVINNLDDRGLYEYVFDAANTTNSVYALIVRSSGIHTFGRALISGWNDDGNIEEISRPQFTVKYQPPYGISKPYKFETAALQTALNEMRGYAGLNQLTA